MPTMTWRDVGRRCVIGLVLTGLIGTGPGCSANKRQNVTGVVTVDGRPVTDGRVQFYGPNNQFSTAGINPDGTFIATDVDPGDLRVAVVDIAGANTLAPPADPALAGSTAKKQAVKIPLKYRDVETSGLRYSISPETAHVEIQMQSK